MSQKRRSFRVVNSAKLFVSFPKPTEDLRLLWGFRWMISPALHLFSWLEAPSKYAHEIHSMIFSSMIEWGSSSWLDSGILVKIDALPIEMISTDGVWP